MVDSKEINAFAIPGGHVYLNRGFILRADSLDEVAGVLGHEISHVVARHGTGTTMLAAMRSHRNSIGIEVDPDYCRMAARCLTAENQTLFSSARLEFMKVIDAAGDEPRLSDDTGRYRRGASGQEPGPRFDPSEF